MEEIEAIHIINVTPENVEDTGIFCIKNKKAPGYHSKIAWFKSKLNHGLKIKIAVDAFDKQLGFIEYLPSELAWRPIKAKNYLFIQCIALFGKAARNKGTGSKLIQLCEQDALNNKKSGICTMSSNGAWMANKQLFEKNGFVITQELDRFELMIKTFETKQPIPNFNDWTKEQAKYTGWNLVYSDQCPWHDKSVTDLMNCAMDHGFELQIVKLETPKAAQKAPSGFGTFSLLKDGRLLADHYISRTRFENILKKEL